jgi:hypothetical protein
MIQAFPEDALFTYSIGGMRPFSALAMEMIGMCSAGIRGVATREWVTDTYADAPKPGTRNELLQLWDEVTDRINELWPRIPPQRFEEVDVAFGQWEASSTGCCSIGSTTKSTTEDKATCICDRSESSRRLSTTEADSS